MATCEATASGASVREFSLKKVVPSMTVIDSKKLDFCSLKRVVVVEEEEQCYLLPNSFRQAPNNRRVTTPT